MATLRTLIFTLVFYGLTIPFVVAALIGAALGDGAMHSVIRAWVRFHRFCARWILGIRVRLEGVLPEGQYLFAGKHQAMFETLDLLNVLRTPAPVLKQELTKIPAWGWLAKHYGGISVDRSGGASAMRMMLRRTRALLETGRSVVIFPEGTRVLPGETPALQAGFAGLYRMFDIPVVAIAIKSGHVWPRKGFTKYPGTVVYRFSEILPTGLPREDIEARVHALINELELAGE
jgi:1-acyl-sn-glycerol-3-phosphate acyltransferase